MKAWWQEEFDSFKGLMWSVSYPMDNQNVAYVRVGRGKEITIEREFDWQGVSEQAWAMRRGLVK